MKSSVADFNQESASVVKRKRGRPRKVVINQENIDDLLQEAASTMLPRTPPGASKDPDTIIPPRNEVRENIGNDVPPPMERPGTSRSLFPNMFSNDVYFDEMGLMNGQQSRGRSFMDLSNILPSFDPISNDADIGRWIDKIEEYANMYRWDDLATRHYALSKLQGVARKWKDSLEISDRTWDDWKVLLKSTFLSGESGTREILEAQNYKRRSNQNIIEYFYEKLAKCNRARMGERETIEWIIDGLDNDQFRAYLGPLSRYSGPAELLPDLKSGSTFIKNNPRTTTAKPTFTRKEMQCFKCQHMGHTARFCSNKEEEEKTPSAQSSNEKKKEIRCFKCNEVGHYARDCKTSSLKKSQDNEREKVLHIEGNSHAKFFKTALINNKEIRCYVDLGSSVTVIRQENADKLQLSYFECQLKPLTGYGGGEVTPVGVMTVKLVIEGVPAKCDVYVVPDDSQIVPLLVGHSYTEQSNVHILNSNGTLNISSNIRELCEIESSRSNKTKLVSEDDIVIPKNYLGHINVVGNICSNDLYVEGYIQECGDVIPRCIVSSNENGESIIPVMNLGEKEIKISRGQTVSRGEVCEEREYMQTVNSEEIKKNEIHSDLNDEDHDELTSLMNKYREVVSTNVHQMGRTNITEMEIKLSSEKPVFYRPYRLSYHEKEQVKDMIADLKKADVIEDSSSPYASPILLVRKTSGEVRLCVDYRALNKMTIKDKYPMPLIDDQIDRLRGHRYFTSLDLFSGYYQVPVARDSREKTAFVTPDGHYQFKRMPFGLCNAPAIFQRMINVIFGNLNGDLAMTYLDDIISACKEFREGIEKLEKILQLLISAGLTLNLKKCHFFKKKIEYLGFEISQSGVEPGTRKIVAVKLFPVPTNVRAIRSFVGLASFFRRFVKNFAIIIKPLTDLLAKGASFIWGEDQQDAFEEVKLRLTSRPILSIYNPKAKTEVHTDASQHGLGAVLFQLQEENLFHPVCYYSRKTTNDEAKYHSFELEALAIVCALEKFRVYLIGIEFVIKTDCNSLKLLEGKRDLNPRIGRWFIRLSEFHYQIEHVKGERNTVADGLSRFPVEPEEDIPIIGLPILGININSNWIAAMQRSCPEILETRDKLEEGDAETHKKFSMANGRVYKITKGRWRLYVPTELRNEIVATTHKCLAHLGIDKTLTKLKETYYFPSMREYVTTYINRCINCLYYKPQTGKKPGYLHPIEKGDIPFETIHVDHLGPLVKTETDNKYVLGVICAFSKYVILEALKTTGSDETIEVLRKLISHYGKPKRIISDRGAASISKKFESFCKEYEIIHVKTAAGSPRANGQIERINSVIINCLPTITQDPENTDWDKRIYDVQWAINNSTHRVTKRTPAEMIFKYKTIGKEDSLLTREIRELNEQFGTELEGENVSELLKTNKEKLCQQFNKKRKEGKILEPGQLVLVRYESPATGESKKLTEKYRGPYEVVNGLGNDRYLIQDIEGEQQSGRFYKGIIALDRLKVIPKGD